MPYFSGAESHGGHTGVWNVINLAVGDSALGLGTMGYDMAKCNTDLYIRQVSSYHGGGLRFMWSKWEI